MLILWSQQHYVLPSMQYYLLSELNKVEDPYNYLLFIEFAAFGSLEP